MTIPHGRFRIGGLCAAGLVTMLAGACSTAAWSGPDHAGVGQAPDFPANLPHWTPRASWADMPRAFQQQWSPVSGPNHDRFPSTMNGCDDQRFLVRWRVVDPNTVVQARWEQGDLPGPVSTSTGGWMDIDGCQTPQFQFGHSSSGDNIADVTVAVEQLSPAP